MIGMDPAALNLIANDFVDLLNGSDACPIVMTWESGTPDARYPGKWIGTPTTHGQALRGMVVFARAYRVQSGHIARGVIGRRFAEIPEADVALLIPDTISMKGLVNVVFTVTGMGDYHPVEKAGEDLSQYAVMFLAGQAMVQLVFCKAAK